MKVVNLYIILLITLSHSGFSQAKTFMSKLQEIEVRLNSSNTITTTHTVLKEETLHSIAQFFRVPLQELLDHNGIKKNQIIPLNTKIEIPINSKYISKSPVKLEDEWIPVVYIVKEKETLYTIGKKYFPQSMEHLNQRNQLNSFIIHSGQRILIGWWPTSSNLKLNKEDSPSSPQLHHIVNREYQNRTLEKNKIISGRNPRKKDDGSEFKNSSTQFIPTLKHIVEYSNNNSSSENNSRRILPLNYNFDSILNDNNIENGINTQGICIWMKNDPETKELLAFHKSAKIGSLINISYPLTNRIAQVKVIDNIDPMLYPDDIDMIVTKAVALKLGARDSRIRINMRYFQ